MHKIEEFKNGVKVSIKEINSGKVIIISRNGEPIVLGIKECEDFLLGYRS
ncbi:hypothetical protein MNB_SV-13-1492 [hydrothermal vent metagenome]|uniref:Uncharacterized protein n=1 Tax=hydrothermal vent metagenome TaxID=652676 RepID=A0A1W1D0Y3_9ZZZZ